MAFSCQKVLKIKPSAHRKVSMKNRAIRVLGVFLLIFDCLNINSLHTWASCNLSRVSRVVRKPMGYSTVWWCITVWFFLFYWICTEVLGMVLFGKTWLCHCSRFDNWSCWYCHIEVGRQCKHYLSVWPSGYRESQCWSQYRLHIGVSFHDQVCIRVPQKIVGTEEINLNSGSFRMCHHENPLHRPRSGVYECIACLRMVVLLVVWNRILLLKVFWWSDYVSTSVLISSLVSIKNFT